MIVVKELEHLTKEELANLVKQESLDRFIYIQFPNKREFMKATGILCDEKLPYELMGYRAIYVTKVVAQYLKKAYGFDFYEYTKRGEEAKRFQKGLVK